MVEPVDATASRHITLSTISSVPTLRFPSLGAANAANCKKTVNLGSATIKGIEAKVRQTVEAIAVANALTGGQVQAGQVLEIPTVR